MTAQAELVHVAGPPEKFPADTSAGWQWQQRCLRCDRPIHIGVWWALGALIYELGDGTFLDDPAPMARADKAEKCKPWD